jgi:hypothetical protein
LLCRKEVKNRQGRLFCDQKDSPVAVLDVVDVERQ